MYLVHNFYLLWSYIFLYLLYECYFYNNKRHYDLKRITKPSIYLISWENKIALNLLHAAAAAAKSCQSCPTLCDPRDGSPAGSRPWGSPGKNTGVGCHFLLQCIKVKGESKVTQSCWTLCNPMDCSQPGSSIHGIFQARVLEWVAIAFSSPTRVSLIS